MGLFATLAAVPGAWARSSHGAMTSGDEPHYLLTAIALAERGTLDVGPELRRESWREFHAAQLPQQAAGEGEHRRVAPHDPLLPALLAGPVGAFGWRAGRLSLAAFNGALAIALLWTAVRRLGVPPSIASVTAAMACASAPFVVYGAQVYPEVPAALAVTVALAAGLGRPRPLTALGVLTAVIALPWLSIKYTPVAAVLALLHLSLLRRERRGRLAAGCLAVYGVAGVAYLLAHLSWYGGLTVYAAGDFFVEHGGQLTVLGTRPDYLGRTRRLLGLLVDRQFGLAAWQPAWLLVVPAVAAVVRGGRPWRSWVLAPLAAAWLMATYAAVTMHGWWFPGRHVLHGLPPAVLAIAWWLSRRPPPLRLVAAAAGATGMWSTAWVVAAAISGRRTMIVDFAATADPWYRTWSRVLPDYFTVTTTTWLLHAGWLLLAIVVVLQQPVRSSLRRRLDVRGAGPRARSGT